jgi:hypothetical protein
MPFAEKCGIGDDGIGKTFEEVASIEEKNEFKPKLTGRTKEIENWLDSNNDKNPMFYKASLF